MIHNTTLPSVKAQFIFCTGRVYTILIYVPSFEEALRCFLFDPSTYYDSKLALSVRASRRKRHLEDELVQS